MSRRALAPLMALLVLVACTASPEGTPRPSPQPTTTAESPTQGSPSATANITPPASPTEAAPTGWTELDASGPAPREDHTWTVDPAGQIAYLFGGRDGATVFGDLWTFDLATDTWAEVAPTGAPPARFGHEAEWVEGVGVVIFAGQAGSQFYGDLWAFDPEASSWRQLANGGEAPTPRYGSCAALGPDGRLWISHGFTQDQVRFSDTRAYDFDLATWTDETPADGRPVERCLHGCWWTDDGDLALFAGQTTGTTALDDRWVLTEGAWSRVEGDLPPARNLYARVRLDGAALVFGGQAADGSYLADLWRLDDGAAATPVVAPAEGPTPAGRAGAEMIVDAERDRVLLFGGRDGDGARADLWELTLP